MAGQVPNPATKSEDPTTIRWWVTSYNVSHWLPLNMRAWPLRMRRITWPVTTGSKTIKFLELINFNLCIYLHFSWCCAILFVIFQVFCSRPLSCAKQPELRKTRSPTFWQSEVRSLSAFRRPVATAVALAWSVGLYVYWFACWSQPYAVLKPINRSRCCFKCRVVWDKNCVLCGAEMPRGKTIFGVSIGCRGEKLLWVLLE